LSKPQNETEAGAATTDSVARVPDVRRKAPVLEAVTFANSGSGRRMQPAKRRPQLTGVALRIHATGQAGRSTKAPAGAFLFMRAVSWSWGDAAQTTM
jgi:hypothetical protein